MRVVVGIFSIFVSFMLAVPYIAHASRVAPISQFGQIQNVQNYSSGVLWNPNGPYNQTFPRPVYVDGPDLNSGDCNRTVFALVSSFCATNNNCVGMQLGDIRPNIMLQLSRMPGHNWATQCVGYIDGAFDEYIKTAQNHVPTTPVEFPTGNTIPNTETEFKIKNPFAPQIPDWAKEMQERKQELKQLQRQTSNYDTSVSYSGFPATYNDLSFAERMDIEADGYEPYRDKSPYQYITIEKAKVVKPVTQTPNVNQNNTSNGTGNGNGGAGNGNAGETGEPGGDVDVADNNIHTDDIDPNVHTNNQNAEQNVEQVLNVSPDNNAQCIPFAVNQLMMSDTSLAPDLEINFGETPVTRPRSNPYSRRNDPDNVPNGDTSMEKCLNHIWRAVLQANKDNVPTGCPTVNEGICSDDCMPNNVYDKIQVAVNTVYTTDTNCVAERANLNGRCYFGVIPYGYSSESGDWYASMYGVRFGSNAVYGSIFYICANLANENIYTNIGL